MVKENSVSTIKTKKGIGLSKRAKIELNIKKSIFDIFYITFDVSGVCYYNSFIINWYKLYAEKLNT